MGLHDLLPGRTFVVETDWSPGVAFIELKKHVAPRGWFGGGDSTFVGAPTEGPEFTFSRRIRYHSPFLPVIDAVVEPSPERGAKIRVSMRLHLTVLAFMTVWMTGACAASLAGIAAALFYGRPAGLIALLVPLVGGWFASSSFALEAREAEALIREIFARAPARNPYRA